jgi:hypothetical protein
MERFVYNDGPGCSRVQRQYERLRRSRLRHRLWSSLPGGLDRLAKGNLTQRKGKWPRRNRAGSRTASHGILTKREWFKRYMRSLGFVWVRAMKIGAGCRVPLADGELPMGRLVVAVSKHYTAVIDGIIHETFDPSRDGTRCVYGYWRKAN